MSVIELTSQSFQSTVLESDKPFLVDFWAEWCGPCRMVSPIVEEIAAEQAAFLTVGKLNVDEQQDVAYNYRVMSIPTLMLFKGGKPAATIVGAMPKADLMRQLSPYLN